MLNPNLCWCPLVTLQSIFPPFCPWNSELLKNLEFKLQALSRISSSCSVIPWSDSSQRGQGSSNEATPKNIYDITKWSIQNISSSNVYYFWSLNKSAASLSCVVPCWYHPTPSPFYSCILACWISFGAGGHNANLQRSGFLIRKAWEKPSEQNHRSKIMKMTPHWKVGTKVCFWEGFVLFVPNLCFMQTHPSCPIKLFYLLSRIIPYKSTDLNVWCMKCWRPSFFESHHSNYSKIISTLPQQPQHFQAPPSQHLWRFSSVDSSMAASSCLVKGPCRTPKNSHGTWKSSSQPPISRFHDSIC